MHKEAYQNSADFQTFCKNKKHLPAEYFAEQGEQHSNEKSCNKFDKNFVNFSTWRPDETGAVAFKVAMDDRAEIKSDISASFIKALHT